RRIGYEHVPFLCLDVSPRCRCLICSLCFHVASILAILILQKLLAPSGNQVKLARLLVIPYEEALPDQPVPCLDKCTRNGGLLGPVLRFLTRQRTKADVPALHDRDKVVEI